MNEAKEKKMHLQIAEAGPDDVAGIAAVQKETWLVTYPNEEYGITVEDIQAKDFDSPERLAKRRESLEKQSQDIHNWIVKDGQKIVGFCIAKKESENGRVQAIYVLPEYQGCGVGKMLIQQAFDWLGIEHDVKVNVAKYNLPSIAFYKKAGFEEVGDVTDTGVPSLPSGKRIPEIEMIRKIKK